jgi:hypothetical protein
MRVVTLPLKFWTDHKNRGCSESAVELKRNKVYVTVQLDDEAWDDTKWVDLEADDDWIQKALAIVAGEDYDTRVSVPMNFSDEELLQLKVQ